MADDNPEAAAARRPHRKRGAPRRRSNTGDPGQEVTNQVGEGANATDAIAAPQAQDQGQDNHENAEPG